MAIDTKNKINLIEKYKAYHDMAMEELSDSKLSPNQIYAVSQYVLDGLVKKAFDKAQSTEEERTFFRSEFEKLLQEELPELVFQTPLIYRPDIGFFKKDES